MTSTAEKLNLQWNEFYENIRASFRSMREDENFFDVTLVCDNEEQINANKVILAASSPFFMNILKTAKHPHPMIYLRGVKPSHLNSLLDFMYNGEVNVYQNDLDEFLSTAKDFKMKGLTEEFPPQIEEDTPNLNDVHKNKDQKDQETSKKPEKEGDPWREDSPIHETYGEYDICPIDYNPNPTEPWNVPPEFKIDEPRPLRLPGPMALATNGSMLGLDMEDDQSIMEKLDNMMIKIDGLWTCNQCGKSSKLKGDIRRHVETHSEGLFFPCPLCDKSYKTRQTRQNHISQKHRENPIPH